jgi:hypothetical protein
VGSVAIPGTARDRSGLTGELEDGTPRDALGAFGSAIAWTGQSTRYVAIPDRGPRDGATTFACRVHEFDIALDPAAPGRLRADLGATTFLRNERGETFVGAAHAFDAAQQERGLRFDPEGLRVLPGGNLLVSDEYGPWIAEFAREGRLVRRLGVPSRFRIARPAAANEQDDSENRAGRRPNNGFEGLALSPDGARAFALLQGPLLQDGAKKSRHCRLLSIDLATDATREHVVSLDERSLSFHELLAVDARRFLAIERDGEAGLAARTKRIVLIDVEGATDVSSIDALPRDLPEGVVAARTSAFLDLLEPRLGLAGPTFPAKIEALCFGPDLPDGRHLLLVASDNDVKLDEPSWIWAFAIPRELLAGSVPEGVDATPAGAGARR